MKRRALLQAFLALPVTVAAARVEVRALEKVNPLTLPPGYILTRHVPDVGVVHVIATDGGWLPCDGRTLSKAEYPALFAVISAFGTLPPSSLFVHSPGFKLPDLRHEFIRVRKE